MHPYRKKVQTLPKSAVRTHTIRRKLTNVLIMGRLINLLATRRIFDQWFIRLLDRKIFSYFRIACHEKKSRYIILTYAQFQALADLLIGESS